MRRRNVSRRRCPKEPAIFQAGTPLSDGCTDSRRSVRTGLFPFSGAFRRRFLGTAVWHRNIVSDGGVRADERSPVFHVALFDDDGCRPGAYFPRSASSFFIRKLLEAPEKCAFPFGFRRSRGDSRISVPKLFRWSPGPSIPAAGQPTGFSGIPTSAGPDESSCPVPGRMANPVSTGFRRCPRCPLS